MKKSRDDAWAARVVELRPKAGDRVEYACPPGELGPQGTVLAVANSRMGWAALVEWDDTSRPGRHGRRGPEAFEPSAFHVGLVKVIPS